MEGPAGFDGGRCRCGGISPRSASPCGAVTIITAAGCGGLGAVTETLPAGFGCASSDLEGGEVQAAGQQVRSTLQGDSPSPYTVNTSSGERVNPFSGMLRDSDRKDAPVGGASWEDKCPAAQQSRSLCAPRTSGHDWGRNE